MDLSNKNNLNILRKAMAQALEQVSRDQGVAFDLGSIRFERDGSRCKFGNLQVYRTDGDAGSSVKEVKMAKQEIEFKQYASLFGLKPEDFGRSFTMPNGPKMITMTIVGLSPRGRKNTIMTDGSDGKSYKMPEETVLKYLSTNPA